MISHYSSYIAAEAKTSQQKMMDLQVEVGQLKEAQSELVQQIKKTVDKAEAVDRALKAYSAHAYELEAELELARGKAHGYQMQATRAHFEEGERRDG